MSIVFHKCAQARLRYARAGSRFVGVGEGGLVACWRQDLAPGVGGVGYADWAHHVRESLAPAAVMLIMLLLLSCWPGCVAAGLYLVP